MSGLKKQQQTAIEAVAKRFSATLEKGGDFHDGRITFAGKRVALDIASLKRRRNTGQSRAAKPHLRFDKVAARVIERLRAIVEKTAPEGTTVLVTITAPIRLPSKTAAALEDKIQALLRRGLLGRDVKDTIHGNRVRLRLLRGESEGAPNMIGFVHNPDSDPVVLFNMTRELLALISAQAGRRAARLEGDRWLVVISGERSSFLEVYRTIYSQLRMATGFKKILMLFGDGRIEALTG